jgi:hypothetical protein
MGVVQSSFDIGETILKQQTIPEDWRVLFVNPQWKLETPTFVGHVEPVTFRLGCHVCISHHNYVI